MWLAICEGSRPRPFVAFLILLGGLIFYVIPVTASLATVRKGRRLRALAVYAGGWRSACSSA